MAQNITKSLWTTLMALMAGVLLQFCTGDARAQLRVSPLEGMMAIDLAKVTMNEAGGDQDDMALIWQAARSEGGDTTQGRRAWLRSHSPCATGVLPQERANRRPGNCRWTRNLRPNGRKPAGWDEAQDGAWALTRPRWRQALRWALELVSGRVELLACAETPETWDGPQWVDQALERGWVAVDCKGTMNIGYRRPDRMASW